jgi:hypothetical protein
VITSSLRTPLPALRELTVTRTVSRMVADCWASAELAGIAMQSGTAKQATRSGMLERQRRRA